MQSPLSSQQDVIADPRWISVVERDQTADGAFFYGVITTGIFCRPSCPSRQAKPHHVRFFASADEAAQAGFRPCLRCKPKAADRGSLHAQSIAEACRLIENASSPPSLKEMAAKAGLSSFHFHRLFKQHVGLTPRDYGAAYRARRLRESLQAGQSVTSAIYAAGFGASSRAYEQTNDILGMKPSAYRKGGVDAVIHFAVGTCTLGEILVAQSQKGLCAILLGDDPDALLKDLQDRFPNAELVGADPGFEHLIATVITFVEAPQIGFALPLDIRGTAFQQRVWEVLRTIPSGETISYAQLAAKLGQPSATRAVAGACAANSLAVAIPCHRVVRTDGTLSGYRWGLERKQALIDREARRGLPAESSAKP